MRTAAKLLLPILLLSLPWAGSAQAYVKFSVENHGAALEQAYIQNVTTLISNIHKTFVSALRLRVTQDVHVTLKFYKERAEYERDAKGLRGMNYSTVPPAFYRHRPMEIWTVDSPQRELLTQMVLHESCHLFLNNLAAESPIWIDEGLAESIQMARLHKGRFVLLPWPQRDQEIKAMLSQGRLPDLGAYLDLDVKTWQRKDDAGEPMRTLSWSLGWFLLSSAEGRQLINDLVRAHQEGRRIEKSSVLIDRYWRGGLKALDAAWRAWIPGTRTPMVLDIPNPEEPSLTTLIR
ncbi:MAG: hypothetical protein AB1916_00905 [Thermodesulfobacteriota bacterium]